MNIGVPHEVMIGEARVALTPMACHALLDAGHMVYVQRGAGTDSGYKDAEYSEIGANLVDDAEQLYQAASLIVKVKQPLESDLRYLCADHVLFSYLHLAADIELIHTLSDIGLTAIPFESVSDQSGRLPLLSPMSQVAGRIATIRGASLLFRNRGGRGVLLGGIDGAEDGRVVVIGAGVAGSHAAAAAAELGAQVDVLDLNQDKLDALKRQYTSICTYISSAELIEELCLQADLVVGAVLVAGRRAPVILKQSVVSRMNPGSVIVDISIDQGGCVEGIRTTSSEELCYVDNGVILSAVPNMPAAVARTSSQALSSAILPYVVALAGCGADALAVEPVNCEEKVQALYRARALYRGELVDEVLQQEVSSAR
jgi:alanine dehydrogenase